MKTLKSIAAGFLALAIAGPAFATTTIYIAGSNGDRANTNAAVGHILNAGYTFAGTKSDPAKANYGAFTGTYTYSGSSTAVVIKVSYIGATGGIAANAGSLPVKFVPDGVTGGSVPDPTVSGNAYDSHVPDFGPSTNFQSTSSFHGTFQGHFYETLNDVLVGVIPLKWLGSKNFPGNNFTTQQAQLLYGNGDAPLALFTGSAAHQNQTVFAIGRNTDAGQRYLALSEPGLGVNAVVKQFKPAITGAAAGVGGYVTGGTVNSHALWPIETFSGVNSQFLGNSGFDTGANLAPALTAVLGPTAYQVDNSSATAGYYIGYLTVQDSDTIAIPNGAVELKWNGVAYSQTALEQGQYTFWGYEHILTRSGLSGIQLDFASKLTTQIHDVDAAVGGILLSNVVVSRSGEGTLVTTNYF